MKKLLLLIMLLTSTICYSQNPQNAMWGWHTDPTGLYVNCDSINVYMNDSSSTWFYIRNYDVTTEQDFTAWFPNTQMGIFDPAGQNPDIVLAYDHTHTYETYYQYVSASGDTSQLFGSYTTIPSPCTSSFGCDVPDAALFHDYSVTSTSATITLPITSDSAYCIVRYGDGSPDQFQQISGVQDTSMTINGLNPGITYIYQVQQVCKNGYHSGLSGMGSFTTSLPAMRVAPNPTNPSNVNVMFNSTQTGTGRILIYNAIQGTVVNMFSWVHKNLNTWHIYRQLQPGTYYVRFTFKGVNYPSQLIIQ